MNVKRISIEVVAGICTCRCIMCSIGDFTKKKQIMTHENFLKIIEKLKPHYTHLKELDFVGNGETMLDKGLPLKIKALKDSGCKASVSVVSNCTELNEAMSAELLGAGLDLLMCSVDGTTKETYEKIRVGADFNVVKNNILRFIEMRNERNELPNKTRIMLRFVNQKLNCNEKEEFVSFWSDKLNLDAGDMVKVYEVHNRGGVNVERETKADSFPRYCKDFFENLMIGCDGDILFCCNDFNASFFDSENIFERDTDIAEVINSETRKHYRRMMREGKMNELKYCKECTIPETSPNFKLEAMPK